MVSVINGTVHVNSNSLSLLFNGHFPSEPGLADVSEAKDDRGGSDKVITGLLEL